MDYGPWELGKAYKTEGGHRAMILRIDDYDDTYGYKVSHELSGGDQILYHFKNGLVNLDLPQYDLTTEECGD